MHELIFIYLFIFSLLLIIIYTYNEIINYYYYTYGELLSKNCKDEKTEFETPMIQYLFNSDQLNIRNFILLFATFIIISIVLIVYIKEHYAVLKPLFKIPSTDGSNKKMRYLYIFITLLQVVFSILAISLYSAYKYRQGSVPNDDHLRKNTWVFIIFNIVILMIAFLIGIFLNYKFLNIIITYQFLLFLLIYIIQSYSDIKYKNESDYIWGISKDSESENEYDFEKTGPFFIATIGLCILGIIINYQNRIKDTKTNKFELIKNPLVHIILILVILAICKRLIYEEEIKNNIENELTKINSELRHFIHNSENSNTNFNKQHLFDTINSPGVGYSTAFESIKEFVDDYNIKINTQPINEEVEMHREIRRELLVKYPIDKCVDIVDIVDRTSQTIDVKLKLIYDFLVSSIQDTTIKTDDKAKFIYIIKKTVSDKYLQNGWVEKFTYEQKKNIINALSDFLEYISKPIKYINEYNYIQTGTGTVTDKDLTLTKDIISTYKKLNKNEDIANTLDDNFIVKKGKNDKSGSTTFLPYLEGSNYSSDIDTTEHVVIYNEKNIKQNNVQNGSVKEKSCLYVPFYDGDIEKTLRKYDLHLADYTELEKMYQNYKIQVKKYSSITVKTVFMEIFLLLILYIIINIAIHFELPKQILILIITILIIIILLALNLKIIVNNVK